jgi:hypothetical protein
MNKYLYFFFFFFYISLAAQNFVLNGKYSKSYNENYENSYTIEGLISFNKLFDIGLFAGYSKLHFNGYEWAQKGDNDMTKNIYGIVTYFYPLESVSDKFLQPIYISFLGAKIADYSSFGGGGFMFMGDGYTYPNTKNDYLLTFSCGYKIDLNIVNILFAIGYQHREYDLVFKEYDSYVIARYSIHKVENSVQVDIGLQFVF